MQSFDPIYILSIILIQIANRHMRIDMTKAQEKIIMHPYTQYLMYICVIYFTTKNIPFTLITILFTYIFAFILLNENHKLNILPKQWLYNENIINEIPNKNNKLIYKENIYKYHQ